MLIRREKPSDRAAIDAVVHPAFATDETTPIEVSLTRRLSADVAYIPELSLLAVDGDTVVGYVIGTRGYLGGLGAVGVGPLAVLPEYHGTGVGSALMHALIGAAEALHEPLLALLGEPEYYRRFGFGPASALGIGSPDPAWGEYFQVLALTEGPEDIGGTFRYAAPFEV